MFIKASALLCFFVLSLPIYALETDNFLAWEVTLPDSTKDVNQFISDQIEKSLVELNQLETPVSCEAVTFAIADRFKTTPQSKILEEFVNHELDKANIHPDSPDYVHESILQDTRFYLKYSGLSPNLQINGYYFGADKLSHFASTGRRYLRYYLNQLSAGSPESQALQSTIKFGLINEATVLGLWPSGVFSYGDMEANFQGFLFYRNLCMTGKKNYLDQSKTGKWKLQIKPDMRDYVNPRWDETFNHSFFLPSSWTTAMKIIKNRYCHLQDSKRVTLRMKYYQAFTRTSPSANYITELQQTGHRHAPIPFKSIKNLCAKNNSDRVVNHP